MTSTIRARVLAQAGAVRQQLVTSTLAGEPLTIAMRALTLGDRTRLVKAHTVEGEVQDESFIPALIIASAHDPETGEQIFQVADLELLSELAAPDLDPLWQAAKTVNGFGEAAVKDAEKNSPATTGSDSASSSPSA